MQHRLLMIKRLLLLIPPQLPPKRLRQFRVHMNQSYSFGPYTIDKSEVFATTRLSYAFVNLRPLTPGHVLLSPKRVVKRYSELTSEEISDIWSFAQKVGSKIEQYFNAEALTLCIQDGALAGQTVPHVHIHCIPRTQDDFENKEFYDQLKKTSTEREPQKFDPDIDRKDRSAQEMAEEADRLRALFN